MPSTLSWRCTPIHSKSRQKAPKSAPTGTRASRALPIADGPVDLARLVPFDVRVAQERHEVVRDRSLDRILEIEDSRIGRRLHQVARWIVAVDEHVRLREVVVEDPAKRLRQRLLLRRGSRHGGAGRHTSRERARARARAAPRRTAAARSGASARCHDTSASVASA
jgi:hypothetical protein